MTPWNNDHIFIILGDEANNGDEIRERRRTVWSENLNFDYQKNVN